MRRALVLFLSAAALSLTASAGYGQYYPYPHPPMPMPYTAQYGYPQPMPAYVPNPMMARPVFYPPAPMQKVFVYGPLDGPAATVPLAPSVPATRPGSPAPQTLPEKVRQAQADIKTAPVISKMDLPPEARVIDEDLDACGPDCHLPLWCRPIRGRGHFIGEIGAYILVPFSQNRAAYTTTTAFGTETTDFPNDVVAGPRASVGYIFHSGWGGRVNYAYLTGVANESTGNTFGSGATFTTPGAAPFVITSPSNALNAGIGSDLLNFRQRLQLHVADAELVKEANFLDTSFLVSGGARYAHVDQNYRATRVNPGGVGAGQTVLLDQENLDTSSVFQGWGPTVSLEVVHPIVCGFSAYGSVRGSFLWGNNRFRQNYGRFDRTVNAGAVVVNDLSLENTLIDNRTVTILEPELGIQFGCRWGKCYLFSRVGAVYQRWWNVGTATRADGYLQFVGGTARVGIAY